MLLELQQYADDIPEEHKKLVRQRIKKYNKNPELLIEEAKALKMIYAMECQQQIFGRTVGLIPLFFKLAT